MLEEWGNGKNIFLSNFFVSFFSLFFFIFSLFFLFSRTHARVELNSRILTVQQVLLEQSDYFVFLEQEAEWSCDFLRALMGCFEKKLWVSATEVLMQVWTGHGFGALPCFLASDNGPTMRVSPAQRTRDAVTTTKN